MRMNGPHMMKLKITTPSANVFSLLIPSEASFEQLHAALEIILHKVPDTYYSFMLMTDRCAIEARGAEEHKLRNCARKALGPKRADILLMYCYLESGNPKLLQLLHKWEKEGDENAREILKELRRMMGE